jgi:hypothetical protein
MRIDSGRIRTSGDYLRSESHSRVLGLTVVMKRVLEGTK